MGRLVKCYYCEKKDDKDTMVRYEDKNFHKKCCEEYQDKRAIYKYVAQIFKFKSENKPGPKIISQLKNYIENYPYTYKGILNTLIYYFEIKKGSVKKADEGIGIVQYLYDEANEYFEQFKIKQNKVLKTVQEQTACTQEDKIVISVTKQKKNREEKYNLENLF